MGRCVMRRIDFLHTPFTGHQSFTPIKRTMPRGQTRSGRIARLLAIGTAVVASLLTFPNAVPWMIGAWLFWHTVAVWRGLPGWIPLVICAALVAAKGTWPTTGLFVLAIAMTGSTALGVLRQIHAIRPDRGLRSGSLIALWLAWGVMLVDWREGGQSSGRLVLDRNATIVCLGDSLTANDERVGSYPEILHETLKPVRVVNLGQPGITSGEALAKLPDLKTLRPAIVVVELGGHDFLRGQGRANAKVNLERIVAAAREAGASVILVEIPRGFIIDPWFGLERQLARELDLTLVPDGVIRSFVLHSPFAPPGIWFGGPYLSDDGLHPNQNGNQAFAAAVARAIDSLIDR